MFNALAIVLAIVAVIAFLICIIAAWFVGEPACKEDQSLLDAQPWAIDPNSPTANLTTAPVAEIGLLQLDYLQELIQEKEHIKTLEKGMTHLHMELDKVGKSYVKLQHADADKDTTIAGLCKDLERCGIEIVKLRTYAGQLETENKTLRTALATTKIALHESLN